MSDLSSDLDLKFLPDWLKESPTENRYANYQGEPTGKGGNRDRSDRRPGSHRPGGPGGAGHGPRPDRPDRRGSRPGGDKGRRPNPQDRHRGDRGQSGPRPPALPKQPQAPTVRVEFIPEPAAAAGIVKQIRSGARAYPLFGTARLFLEKPERHRVKIISLDEAKPLFQIGDGPVSFERASVERDAFQHFKAQYYTEEVVQSEPLKGNFTNVAKSRTTGALLGPTNYHSYQPTLRKLYEERFSRRMSFAQFQQEEIVVLNDEQAVADWKEQARTSVRYTTTQEAEPVVLKSAAEAEQHFRKTYLPGLIKSGTSLETSGHASRACHDRGIVAGLREGWEKERGFPGGIVHHLRPLLTEAGIHFFKHRKRVLYVSPVRPQRHAQGQNFSEGIGSILSAVEAQPRISKPQLAAKLLGEPSEAAEYATRKAALAGDLHYLVHAGHVIEFHDGTLDLPLSPKAEAEENREKPESASQTPAEPEAVQAAPAAETAPEAAAMEATGAPAPEAPAEAPSEAAGQSPEQPTA